MTGTHMRDADVVSSTSLPSGPGNQWKERRSLFHRHYMGIISDAEMNLLKSPPVPDHATPSTQLTFPLLPCRERKKAGNKALA